MAEIHELIERVEEPELRAQLKAAVDQLNRQKKFGLVFEEHLPECTPLYEVPVAKGKLVARKQGEAKEMFVVLTVTNDVARCLPKNGGDVVDIPVAELVSVAEFGEPIYPYLRPMDTVCNAPDSDLWHTLIEADNYHALQLLEYLYAGKVDCIYIDPPYNTGAKDWKYNNDYVDGNDQYRHSKWLSMMQKRLKLAKKLLNPTDSVLIITIDEKEYLHLGCLLEEMFPSARIQMVSSVISPQGATRDKQFSRTDEYIFFVGFGDAAPQPLPLSDEWSAGLSTRAGSKSLIWDSLKRRGVGAMRKDRPNLFYPVYVSEDGKSVVKVGESLPVDGDRNDVPGIDGCVIIWPLRSNGEEGRWQIAQEEFKSLLSKGYIRLGKFDDVGGMSISYLKKNERKKVESGAFQIIGKREDGSIVTNEAETAQKRICGTQWRITTHNAGTYGSASILKIFNTKRFDFPKSLYAVHDAIRFYVANKPDALIVDFFAGSGTTLHAVNLLNAEDNGHRRCILVTNNEVSVDEAKTLTDQGHQPGDEEWEKLGIARYVTWPRTVCSIEGHDVNGQPLKGDYLGSDRPMSEGFAANAAYFKLGFLDKTSVALGQQFQKMLPTLWMKAGAKGPCPTLEGGNIPPMLVLPENGFAVLTEQAAFEEFAAAVNASDAIQTAYIVTDYEAGYSAMAKQLHVAESFQLYRDYLDNFRINTGRDAR